MLSKNVSVIMQILCYKLVRCLSNMTVNFTKISKACALSFETSCSSPLKMEFIVSSTRLTTDSLRLILDAFNLDLFKVFLLGAKDLFSWKLSEMKKPESFIYIFFASGSWTGKASIIDYTFFWGLEGLVTYMYVSKTDLFRLFLNFDR